MHIDLSCLRVLVLLLGFVFVGNACTQKESTSSMRISLSSSQNTAVATGDVYEEKHIIVQVGESEPREWNCEMGDGCNSITLETQSGKRALQILVIADKRDETSKTMGLYYFGDVIDIPPGEFNFAPDLLEIATNAKMTVLSGRYVPSPSVLKPNKGKQGKHGPYLTGEWIARLQAADIPGFNFPTLPEMGILQGEMFGGFTKMYLFDDLPMRMYFKGYDEEGNPRGDRIMQDLHPGDKGLTPKAEKLEANGAIISHYSLGVLGDVNGTYFEEPSEVEVSHLKEYLPAKIVGFFGHNSDNRTLCAISVPYGEASPQKGLCRDKDCTEKYSWDDMKMSVEAPGYGAQTCSNETPTMLPIDLNNLADDDGGAISAHGPWVGSGSTLGASFDEESGKLTWRWNPNVHPSRGVPAAEFFTRVSREPFNDDLVRLPKGGGIDCNKLHEIGFKPVVNTRNNSTAFDRNDSSYTFAEFLDGNGAPNPNFTMAVCFRKPGGGYYATGHISRDHNSSASSAGPNSNSPLELRVVETGGTGGPAVRPGHDYGDPVWDNWPQILMAPTSSGTAVEIWFEMRNKTGSAVSIESAHFHASISDMAFEWSTGDAAPSGTTKCSGFIGGAFSLASGASCAFKMSYTPDPTLLTEPVNNGSSLYQSVVINTMQDGEAAQFGFELVGLVYTRVAGSMGGNTEREIWLHAPERQRAVKVIRMHNNASSNGWNLGDQLPASGHQMVLSSSSESGVKITHNCGFVEPQGECDVYLFFNNPEGSGLADDTSSVVQTLVVSDVDGGSYETTIMPMRLTSEPSIQEANYVSGRWEYRFLETVPENSFIEKKLVITSLGATPGLDIYTPPKVLSEFDIYDISLYTPGLQISASAVSASGSYEYLVKLKHAGETIEGLRDRLNFWYEYGDNFRVFDLDVISDHE